MDNKTTIKRELMIKYFKQKLVNDQFAVDLTGNSGMGACKYVREKYLIMLNDGRENNQFLRNEDAEENGTDDSEAVIEEED